MTDLHRLRSEVFHLAYHLHWGWADIMNLAMDERRSFLDLLSDQLDRESKAVKSASRGRR